MEKYNAETMAIAPQDGTTTMFWGLARHLLMGRDLNYLTSAHMRIHLQNLGVTIPEWLDEEMKKTEHISKSDMCVWIYKAMLNAAPAVEPVVPLSEVLELLESDNEIQNRPTRAGNGELKNHLIKELKQKYGVSE